MGGYSDEVDSNFANGGLINWANVMANYYGLMWKLYYGVMFLITGNIFEILADTID